MKIKKLFRNIIDLIYPQNIKCLLCNKELNIATKHSLCEKCFSKLTPNTKKKCVKCGVAIFTPLDKCKRCYETERYFDKAISIFLYEKGIKELLHKFKFNKGKYIGENLSNILLERYEKENLNCDIIIPVPLSRERGKERGYNQALELCKSFEEKYEVRNDILIKQKNTKNQASLSQQERMENLIDCFACKNKDEIKDKTILLIDDIFTTGSTVNECSKTLKESGAKRVYVMTVASAIYNPYKIKN